MKTLIFQGSPHEHGDTAYLTGLLAQRLSGEVRTVHAYRCAIRPCVDCRACWKTPGCRINDGMQAVYAQIRESDHIVIASPLYFSELSSVLFNGRPNKKDLSFFFISISLVLFFCCLFY